MDTLKNIFAGPSSRRPHRILGAVALLITWSFFGTTHQVMHTGSFLEMLGWLAGTDVAFCLYRYARRASRTQAPRSMSEKTENTPADKDEMGRAA